MSCRINYGLVLWLCIITTECLITHADSADVLVIMTIVWDSVPRRCAVLWCWYLAAACGIDCRLHGC